MSKPIRLSRHAREQLESRGAVEKEVVETIRQATWEPAEKGRWECQSNLPFNAEWKGAFYQTRQVRPIFVEERMEIVVVTVYVYYF